MKKPVLSNAVICALIGAVFGFLLREMIPWLIGGAMAGGLTGWVAEVIDTLHALAFQMCMLLWIT